MSETFRVIAKCSFFEMDRKGLTEDECNKLLKHLKTVKEDMALLIANVAENIRYDYWNIWNFPLKVTRRHKGFRIHQSDVPLSIEIQTEQLN